LIYNKLEDNSIIFVSKGSNILNLVIKTKLNNEISPKNYSDLDFEIKINKNITAKQLNIDTIIKDMKQLTYILLKEIRNNILNNFDLGINLVKIMHNINNIIENKIYNLSLKIIMI
jgi:thiamine biosynthesis protein ThiC